MKKERKQLVRCAMLIGSLLFLAACHEHGPNVPECFVMEDLVTEYCFPFDPKDKEFMRKIKAGDYVFSPEERGRIQHWVEQHKKR